MYTKAEKQLLFSYLNKVKDSLDFSFDVLDIDYLEDPDDIEGWLLQVSGVAFIIFYMEDKKVVCGVRFCKDLKVEDVAMFTIDLAKIIPDLNIYVYKGFYYNISDDLVFGEDADLALQHERYTQAVESYLKEISDPIFSPTGTGKIYRC